MPCELGDGLPRHERHMGLVVPISRPVASDEPDGGADESGQELAPWSLDEVPRNDAAPEVRLDRGSENARVAGGDGSIREAKLEPLCISRVAGDHANQRSILRVAEQPALSVHQKEEPIPGNALRLETHLDGVKQLKRLHRSDAKASDGRHIEEGTRPLGSSLSRGPDPLSHRGSVG